MSYEKLIYFSDFQIKRKVGVSRVLFEILAEIIKQALIEKLKNRGRKPRLSSF